jgi:transposase
VLDNARLHTGRVVREARRRPARRGIDLYVLPPYGPELNGIEPVLRQAKYHEMPGRSHTTRLGLREAVEEGFSGYGRRLRPKYPERLRPAA